jgi:hypothetical protein
LFDAIAAIDAAMGFLAGHDLAAYEANLLLRSGAERQLEILGEACATASFTAMTGLMTRPSIAPYLTICPGCAPSSLRDWRGSIQHRDAALSARWREQRVMQGPMQRSTTGWLNPWTGPGLTPCRQR